jgi:hypothetical protein
MNKKSLRKLENDLGVAVETKNTRMVEMCIL